MKKIIALRKESIDIYSRVPCQPRTKVDEYIEHMRDNHICDLYRYLGDEALDDPSIPPLENILPDLNTKPTSGLPTPDETLMALLSLLNTPSVSTGTSHKVCSLADLTDAEFEQLKAVSTLGNGELDLLRKK